jgi:hypothetical protein
MGIADKRRHDGRSRQPASVRERIAAAMSWLAECIVDGFAAYGNAMYPTFIDLGETEDFRQRRWNEEVPGYEEFALLRNNPWVREHPQPAERETETMVSAMEIRDD